MNLEILEEKDNSLMKRKELIVKLDYENSSTVSRAELELAISKVKKEDVAKIEVTKILSEHGKPFGKAWIRIWEVAPETKKGQVEKKEEPKKEETPAAPVEKPAEKPAEKPKEEPVEKKPEPAPEKKEEPKKEEPKKEEGK